MWMKTTNVIKPSMVNPKGVRMKKSIIIAVISGIGFLSSPFLVAEGLSVFGSYWSPSSGEESLGAGLSLRGGDGLVYFEVRGTYFEDIKEDTPLYKNKLQLVPVDVGIGFQLDVTEMLGIYGGGGFTYYFLDSDTADVDNEVGYYLQAGAELTVNEGFGVFSEVIWREVEASLKNDINLEDSKFDLAGISVNVGVVFTW
jgi:hypothetical protein